MHQAISDSQFGQQNAWPGRIDFNRFAQFADDDAQVMRIIEVRATPNLLHDLLTRDHLAGVVRVPNQIFLRTETSRLPPAKLVIAWPRRPAGASLQFSFRPFIALLVNQSPIASIANALAGRITIVLRGNARADTSDHWAVRETALRICESRAPIGELPCKRIKSQSRTTN